ncbi:MAG: HupE/UreJ family protein [Pseudomonadota bacterium]
MTNKLLTLSLLLLFSGALQAHTRSEAWSEWQVDGNHARVEITLSSQDLTRFTTSETSMPSHELSVSIAQQFSVRDQDASCTLVEAQPLPAAEGYQKFLAGYQCLERPHAVRIDLMLGKVPGHVHVVRYGPGLQFEQVLTTKATEIIFDQGAKPVAALPLFYTGFIHILYGADHLAFLLGLLLITASMRQRIWVISGFTLGHSLSLALAAGGWIQTIDARVEATIGFTVLLTGAVYLARLGAQHRQLALAVIASLAVASFTAIAFAANGVGSLLLFFGLALVTAGFLGLDKTANDNENTLSLVLLASVFGLFHGFGFAGFLSLSGISGAALIVPVLSFNLGVEAGQLCLLGIALIVVALAQKQLARTWRQASATIFALFLVAIGSFWLFSRAAQL